MAFIQKVSGFGMAVPEVECYCMVKDRRFFHLRVHRGFVVLLKAKDLGDQLLHGFIAYAGVVAGIFRTGAVPRPRRSTVFAFPGLAAVIGTATATLDEAGKLIEQMLVRVCNNRERSQHPQE